MEVVTGKSEAGRAPTSHAAPADPRRLRIFLLKALLFAAVWGALFFRGDWGRYGTWMACSAALVAAGLLMPSAARVPRRMVIALGSALGRGLAWLALAVIYWLVLVPVALLARLTGKRFLEKGPDPAAASYWIPRESKAADKATLERQF